MKINIRIVDFIKKHKIIAGLTTIIFTIASVVTILSFFENRNKDIVSNKEINKPYDKAETKLLSLDSNKKKELIVKNITNQDKVFFYRNPERGRGSGRIIKSNTHHSFLMEGNYFNYLYYNLEENKSATIDTLGKGNISMRIPMQKVIVLDK